MSDLPSAIAGSKLKQLIAIKDDIQKAGSSTMVARLTHARLFGSDRPYEERSKEELADEMRQIERQYQNQDEHFLFEEHARQIQIVVYNQGDETIRDASLSVMMPNHAEFYVATNLPMIPSNNKYQERSPGEHAEYPSVSMADDSVQISAKLGDIPPGEFVDVFNVPLRLCVGSSLRGKRFGMQYSLFAQNLRTPATGKLRLLF